jgi:5-dehydro-4-deoxyglucarate dehydratase
VTFAFADAPLFFPVTAFAPDGTVDHALTREHIERGIAAGPGGVFPACGTGEFHALSAAESVAVARTAVEAVAGRVPVVAGVGGPVGQAIESARALDAAGVDGLLLLPPYLVGATQAGLEAYVAAVAASVTSAASALPIIVYHRANARFEPETFARLLRTQPNVVGFKDGIGDIALAQQIVLAARAVRDDVQFFNGLLTAEASQAAYRAISIPLYSSAVFAMAPDIAHAFYRAYVDLDDERCAELLSEFYFPLVALRDTTPGYAVALIKAGVRLSGLPVGGVRPPLVDPGETHAARLAELLAIGHALAAPASVSA